MWPPALGVKHKLHFSEAAFTPNATERFKHRTLWPPRTALWRHLDSMYSKQSANDAKLHRDTSRWIFLQLLYREAVKRLLYIITVTVSGSQISSLHTIGRSQISPVNARWSVICGMQVASVHARTRHTGSCASWFFFLAAPEPNKTRSCVGCWKTKHVSDFQTGHTAFPKHTQQCAVAKLWR